MEDLLKPNETANQHLLLDPKPESIDHLLDPVFQQEDSVKAIMALEEKHIGRPTVITESVVRILIAAFQRGLTDTTACELAQISRTSYYKAISENEVFADKIKQAKSFLKLFAGKTILYILEHGSDSERGRMARWILEHKEPTAFPPKPNIGVVPEVVYHPPSWFTPPENVSSVEELTEKMEQDQREEESQLKSQESI